MDDEALLVRQADLQRDAATVVRELDLVAMLGRAGRVLQLGSWVTGLMVWRDVDFGVDARDVTADAAWETMRPVLHRCSSLHYANDRDERRHYFVMRIEGWKVSSRIAASWTTPRSTCASMRSRRARGCG